jgi:hypothetical protein
MSVRREGCRHDRAQKAIGRRRFDLPILVTSGRRPKVNQGNDDAANGSPRAMRSVNRRTPVAPPFAASHSLTRQAAAA